MQISKHEGQTPLTLAQARREARLFGEMTAKRDAARRKSLFQAGVFPAPQFRPNDLAEAMAGHMIEIAQGGAESCSDADLALRGFTMAEIEKHGAEARRIAFGMAAESAERGQEMSR
ncbi:hypothetical protein SAMN06297251_12751 [Fulvimarina manganoxydans]|uniref:Uncharacterized protein n=1 Tax=Fulvimarina manganoxydans TaxID=937218 RepID=A0A1W2EM74_9HYPH|nr:hypothetical protein [Fulvimarina manganoxydans]SMD10228.1 hypothetical protein SAMN06297251_12751 [Fulvimarina manganoxydans]